ncbi:hypothetical protein T492DRAFT_986108 [Pavlovales sp. CCMP2436]|nr:hypothetical protein T492DRAFT_986108 [Pavlovales sp. CCMP2436]|mmetsp:Transcript_5195/g.12951  ORF Transcript_5195/g.12951 Transcript_5195/m.12951 type:complete len:188 (+) Transcript_5195:90-653(+)
MPKGMRRDVALLLVACLPLAAAYFDINLLSDVAKIKSKQNVAERAERLQHRRVLEAAKLKSNEDAAQQAEKQHRRKLQEEATPAPEQKGGTFFDRLGEKGKSAGKRAAITTVIAIAVVVVVCLCCWCVPMMEIACWGKARDDAAFRETYLPEDKPPTLVNVLSDGDPHALPVAAGDLIARRPISVQI